MKSPPRFIRSPRVRTTILAVASVVAIGVVFACADSIAPDESGTFFGPLTVMAGGSARAYVTLDRAGAPTELGVALNEASLTGLPAAAAEYVFALPAQASTTAYKHAVINWAPTGHPPAGVYTVPHFDVHFYMIDQTQREAILLGDAQLAAKMANQPAAPFVPAGYAIGMGSALMGLHWNDPEAPERKGAPFTKTFIYGSYDGTFTFGEPMMSLAYLQTKPVADVTTIKLPTQYATKGYQPTTYTIDFDANAKEYRIALTGLVNR
ncbi:MAG: DUF5602 domain-containing protein [bacterium]